MDDGDFTILGAVPCVKFNLRVDVSFFSIAVVSGESFGQRNPCDFREREVIMTTQGQLIFIELFWK